MEDVTAVLADSTQRARLCERFGVRARDWLAGVPALVAKLASEWELTVEGPAPPGRTSMVLRCRRADGRPAILKLSPDAALIGSEARILGLWHGKSCVPEVLEADTGVGALLMEAVEPGTTLSGMAASSVSLESVGRLITCLHTVTLSPQSQTRLRPLQGWVTFFFDQWEWRRAESPAAETVAPALLYQGHAKARVLAAEQDDAVALHGDLHPGNVLLGGERGLVAIDPRGCVGDAAFDAVDWPMWQAESVSEIERRIEVLAPAVGTSADRLRRWCQACAPIHATALANRPSVPELQLATVLEFAAH